MDIANIRKEITALLNSIKEHSESIENKEFISQIELDHFLYKIENLHKKLIVLSYLNTLPKSAETNQLSIFNNLVEPQEEIIHSPASVEKTAILDTIIETVSQKAEIGTIIENAVAEEKIVVGLIEEVETPVIPIVETEKKISSNKIQKPPLADMKTAIGINDKFRFINELFKGNSREYETAIQRLNTANTSDSAQLYFSELQQSYNWKEDSESKLRLLDLVERRYS